MMCRGKSLRKLKELNKPAEKQQNMSLMPAVVCSLTEPVWDLREALRRE